MAGIFEGDYWLFDPRYRIEKNTLLEPMADGGGKLVEQTRLDESEIEEKNDNRYRVLCSNARMTFLNEQYCRLSYDSNTCSPRDPPDISIDLVPETFEKMYKATIDQGWRTRYVYAIKGLKQHASKVPYDSPCTPGETSRWVPSDCASASSNVQFETRKIFVDLLRNSDDENEFLRDIAFPATGVSCSSSDVRKFNFEVKVDNQCWLNVHQSHLVSNRDRACINFWTQMPCPNECGWNLYFCSKFMTSVPL